jgi:hypothetical protein
MEIIDLTALCQSIKQLHKATPALASETDYYFSPQNSAPITNFRAYHAKKMLSICSCNSIVLLQNSPDRALPLVLFLVPPESVQLPS